MPGLSRTQLITKHIKTVRNTRLAQLLLAQMMPIDLQWVRIMSVTMTAHAGGVQVLHSHRDKEGHRFSQLSCAASHAKMVSCPRKGKPTLACAVTLTQTDDIADSSDLQCSNPKIDQVLSSTVHTT